MAGSNTAPQRVIGIDQELRDVIRINSERDSKEHLLSVRKAYSYSLLGAYQALDRLADDPDYDLPSDVVAVVRDLASLCYHYNKLAAADGK